MIVLTTWMRRAMLATAAMNIGAAVGFLPGAQALRALTGFPDASPPLYACTVALFVLLFGIAYLCMGLSGRADRLLLAIAAAGKLSFFALLIAFWSAGDLPLRAPLLGAWDLVFGVLFVMWLLDPSAQARPHAIAATDARAS
jgi:hypothetical protein